MADEELTVKASIDDELSAPLREIREDLNRVGDEASTTGRRASVASRGWDTFGRAAHKAGRLAKGALVGLAAGVAAAGYAAARLAVSSIKEASTLNESLNAVNVTYGKQAKAVKQLGREAAKAIGLSNVEFNGMAVQFAAFATAIGGEGKGAVRVLDDVTTRAADFASVMNIEVAEAAALFQSGLAGESEPLRKYGINLSAAAVESYALAKGIVESGEKLTDAQKITATYGLLMEKTSKTQGDFANTSDSLANQQRILGARFDNAQAKLGKGLLPMMQTGVKWLNREGIPAFLRFSDWFTDEGIPKAQRFIEKGRELYERHLPKIKDVLADVRDVAQAGADAGKELVDAFVGMPPWARKLLIGGAAGAIVGKKLGLGSLLKGGSKGAGGLLGLVSKAKPLPVFVVNNGVGGGLPGDGPGGKPKGGGVKGALKTGAKYVAPAALAYTAYEATAGDMFGLDSTPGEKRQTVSPFGVGLTPPSKQDTAAHEAAAKRVEEAYARAMDLSRAKAAGFGRELDLVGARKVEPRIKADSIKDANDYLYKFIGYQRDAGRPVTPYINTSSIERALTQVATLTTAIHSIPTAGVDNGVTFVGGGAGGRGGDPPVKPRKPAPTLPLTPRLAPTGGKSSNVTVAPGAITVNNPASEIDLERAVTAGISNYVREREERG